MGVFYTGLGMKTSSPQVVFLLVLPCLAFGLGAPDCGPDDNFDYADPEACSYFYRCEKGELTHLQCQPDEDGMPRLFDEVYEFCTYTDSVDCGDRPCKDPIACVTQPPKTTETTTPDCGHIMDCKELGQGIHADPYNCRKYWDCVGEVGTHHLCPDDPATGEPELFDLVYMGCNYAAYTDCGDRPICGVCDEDCRDPPTTPKDCGHKMDCSDKDDGWYADPWNCRKYWQCSGGKGIHHMCKDDQQYNPKQNWCDYDENVTCGDRPVCDECDEDCHEDDNSNDADCGPDDHHPPTICKGRPDGWYPTSLT